MNDICITSIGLILNFLGAVLLAFSFSASEKQGDIIEDSGKKRDFVLCDFHKRLFRVGISIMSIGFLCQLVAVLFFS